MLAVLLLLLLMLVLCRDERDGSVIWELKWFVRPARLARISEGGSGVCFIA